MAAALMATSLDGTAPTKEEPMFTSPMIGELATARHSDLIATAAAERLARQARHARRVHRDQARSTKAGRVRRIWLRTTTQPAHS
jgi:hypothetical protein